MPLSGAHRSRALEAARRSSTSANETIRKHDHRTIDTRLRIRRPDFRRFAARWPVRGSFLLHPRLTGAARGPRSRGLSGQGPLMSIRARALLDRHPPAAMARSGGFAPTRCGSDTSCRASALPPAGVAGVMHGAPTNPRYFVGSPRPPACAVGREGRLTHLSAKRRCDPLHPRCLPSGDPPFGRAQSTSCPQPVDG